MKFRKVRFVKNPLKNSLLQSRKRGFKKCGLFVDRVRVGFLSKLFTNRKIGPK